MKMVQINEVHQMNLQEPTAHLLKDWKVLLHVAT